MIDVGNFDDWEDTDEFSEEYAAELWETIAQWEAGTLETVSLEEVKRELGIFDEE